MNQYFKFAKINEFIHLPTPITIISETDPVLMIV